MLSRLRRPCPRLRPRKGRGRPAAGQGAGAETSTWSSAPRNRCRRRTDEDRPSERMPGHAIPAGPERHVNVYQTRKRQNGPVLRSRRTESLQPLDDSRGHGQNPPAHGLGRPGHPRDRQDQHKEPSRGRRGVHAAHLRRGPVEAKSLAAERCSLEHEGQRPCAICVASSESWRASRQVVRPSWSAGWDRERGCRDQEIGSPSRVRQGLRPWLGRLRPRPHPAVERHRLPHSSRQGRRRPRHARLPGDRPRRVRRGQLPRRRGRLPAGHELTSTRTPTGSSSASRGG